MNVIIILKHVQWNTKFHGKTITIVKQGKATRIFTHYCIQLAFPIEVCITGKLPYCLKGWLFLFPFCFTPRSLLLVNLHPMIYFWVIKRAGEGGKWEGQARGKRRERERKRYTPQDIKHFQKSIYEILKKLYKTKYKCTQISFLINAQTIKCFKNTSKIKVNSGVSELFDSQ